MTDNIQEESRLSLIDLLNIFKKNLLIIIISTLLVVILGVLYVFVITKPVYKSTAVVMVQVVGSEKVNDSADITTSLRIVNTVAEFMQSEAVINDVSKKFNIDSKVIFDNLSIDYSSSSLNIRVIYTSKDESIICDVINEIISISKVRANLEDSNGDFIYPTIAKTISVVSNATKTTQVGMGKTSMITICVIIGVIIGMVIAFLKELLNNTVHDIDEIERLYKVKVIGVIPSYQIKGSNRNV